MIHRLPKLSKSNSFFLFGARGTGKSSLIHSHFKGEKNVLYVDLLKSEWEDELLKNPDFLIHFIEMQAVPPKWILIDEVQKIPKLLDTVHHLIESKKIKFALTGSSARKLKRGSANLLAGRAFSFELFPLTHLELKEKFQLEKYLAFGGLPALTGLRNQEDINQYLKTYITTYLKEEILAEQIVRNLKPFRLFLDVAAQMNAKIVNYSKIGTDIGADTKSVQNYFEILRDTHIGILLPSHDESLRKRQRKNPKFYYFDTGVVRSLNRKLNLPLKPSTFEFGDLFEQFIILEMHRLNSYFSLDFEFSYLKTNNDLEIDIIIDRPGLPRAYVEIKSTNRVLDAELTALKSIKRTQKNGSFYCLSNDTKDRIEDGLNLLHWRKGLLELGFVGDQKQSDQI